MQKNKNNSNNHQNLKYYLYKTNKNKLLMNTKNKKWKIIDTNVSFAEEDSQEIEQKNMNKYVEILLI